MPIKFLDEHTIEPIKFDKPEWLSTGQMIDSLKVGEIAEVVDAPFPLVVGYRIFFDGKHYWWEDPKANDRFYLNHNSVNLKWIIISKSLDFVTFGEAMQALHVGKTITYHDDGPEKYTFDLKKDWQLDELEIGGYSFADLLKPRWTING